MNINTAFSRLMLSSVMEDVRKVTTAKERKSVWTYHFGSGHWEFHGIDGFYWHGEADNAYDAKAKGWAAWWDKLEREGADLRAMEAGKRQREQEWRRGRAA